MNTLTHPLTTHLSKGIARFLVFACLLQSTLPLFAFTPARTIISASSPAKQPVIQIAILLDTSSSMDGLIAQAKSQLWNMVKELALANYHGSAPKMEIALYQYGNDGLSQKSGYIQQISPFTSDLDKISDELFKLTTNGGSEYCPQAIVHACKDLSWRQGEENMRFLFIAGNEVFAQGSVTPEQACNAALAQRVSVSAIHCGDEQTGRNGGWDKLPTCTEGRYLYINGDYAQRYISTPYDSAILKLNSTMNTTYLPYGAKGREGLANQSRQDMNSLTVASSNMVERAVAKSTDLYKNSSWDFIDAVTEQKLDLNTASKDDLPKEFQNLDKDQRKKKFEELQTQRAKAKKEISSLEKKRQEYITNEEKKNATSADADKLSLQKRMITVVRELATKRGYSFK